MTPLGIKAARQTRKRRASSSSPGALHGPARQYNKHAESPDFGNKNRDRYDNEVFYTDLWIGKLLDFARAQPWWKDTVLIISADHGEAFGEQRLLQARLRDLGRAHARATLDLGPWHQAASHQRAPLNIDLAPTILDIMGVPPSPNFMGKSTLPELEGAAARQPRAILSELTEDSHNPPRRAFILGDYKLLVIKERKFQLYKSQQRSGRRDRLGPERTREAG